MVKRFYNLTLSTNGESSTASNFILQSKSMQTILELVYRLSERVENGKDLGTVEVLDMLHDIRLMKELHAQQLSKVANDRTLSRLLDEISPKYRERLIERVHQYQKSNYNTQKGE